jgi:molybdopterin molybdotransferase
LLSVAEARYQLLANFSPLEPIKTPVNRALGKVLAEEVVAHYDIPPFNNSSMDGFAVSHHDLLGVDEQNPAELVVVADIPAGQFIHKKILRGQAARIMTGAPAPDGCDSVIPVEDTDFNQRQQGISAPACVKVFREVQPGENIRLQGQDVHKGEIVLLPGTQLRPQEIGFLAMLGIAEVSVHRSPRVAIFSTGDELIPIEIPLLPGKIHDSNSYTLMGQVEQNGGIPLDFGIVADEVDAIQKCLDRAVEEKADLILSSAGVSVGAFDFVRNVIERYGHLSFWRVNMRPGKPLAVGDYHGVPFIGLPGNPVSAFVGFEIFVRPALKKMAGIANIEHPMQSVVLLDMVESDGRESYLRAFVDSRDGKLEAHLTGHQGSGNLRSLVQANALLLIPSGVKSLPIGTKVAALLLNSVNLDKSEKEL